MCLVHYHEQMYFKLGFSILSSLDATFSMRMTYNMYYFSFVVHMRFTTKQKEIRVFLPSPLMSFLLTPANVVSYLVSR